MSEALGDQQSKKYNDIRWWIHFKRSENRNQFALTSLQETQNTTILFTLAPIHGRILNHIQIKQICSSQQKNKKRCPFCDSKPMTFTVIYLQINRLGKDSKQGEHNLVPNLTLQGLNPTYRCLICVESRRARAFITTTQA